jgi:archaemetzincin
MGFLDPMIPPIVAGNIHTVIGLTTHIQKPRARPDFAFSAARRQFDATKIIAALASESTGAPLRLGLLHHDLCVPILSYVYGESQIGGRAAVISSYRLFDARPEMVYERAAKIGVHEIGHLLGLNHCWQIDCLMHFSKQLDQLDRLPLNLCETCTYEIARSLQRADGLGF